MELLKNPLLFASASRVKLQVLDFGHAVCMADEWGATINSPGYSRLYYIIGGDSKISYNGIEMALLPYSCYLIPTGFSFSHSCSTGMEQIYFHINLLNSNGYDLLRNCKQPIKINIEGDACKRLCSYISKDGLSASLQIESEILSSLAHLFDQNGISPAEVSHSPSVALAIEHISKNPTIQLTPSQLAELAFVSLSALSKRFKSEVGKPIGAYIDDIVFFEAEQLLRKRRDEISIQDISQRLGFCDQFYFSRRFKEKYKMTPQQYRGTCVI